MKRWRVWFSAALLLLCSTSLASCAEENESSAVSSVATLSGTASVASCTEQTEVFGEYLSVEGDGEVLLLREDGTFLASTVRDLGATNSSGGTVTITERVEGNYRTNGDGTLTLQIATLLLKVDGMEEEPTMVDEYARLMAGADERQYEVYARMFGGTEVDGTELYGEDAFAKIAAETVKIRLDAENAAFGYMTESK